MHARPVKVQIVPPLACWSINTIRVASPRLRVGYACATTTTLVRLIIRMIIAISGWSAMAISGIGARRRDAYDDDGIWKGGGKVS